MEWFEAQILVPVEVSGAVSAHRSSAPLDVQVWKKPEANWVKCNVGVSWSNKNRLAGGAWVLRNELGVVVLHSRRSFSGINSKEDAMLRCVLWAMESMASHKINRVSFAFQDKALVGAVTRPIAWPSFKPQSAALTRSLRYFSEWKLEVEDAAANRGANLIAQSVTGDLRCQSYVALGHPQWLHRVFVDEEGLSPV